MATNNTIQEVFAAIDTLIAAREKQGDTTIKCHIINADNAEHGEYLVDDGVRKFIVYSDNKTYKAGEYVFVFMPGGNQNKEYRYILGKCISTDTPYYTYVSPAETYVDITGNIIEDEISTDSSIKANGTDFIELCRFQCHYSGYDRLFLSADFMSWLSTYKLISGNYGIRLDVQYEKQTTITSSISDVVNFYLDSDDMYGDPYAFETYYTQEGIFDISNFDTITAIRVVLYQKDNFALGKDKPLVTSDLSVDDIFCRNIVVSLGYDLSNFDSDKVILQTPDSTTYADSLTDTMKEYLHITDDMSLNPDKINRLIESFNSKDLSVRWIRKKDDTLSAISSIKDKPDNVKIHWYQYVLEQGLTDPLAGAFWKERTDWYNCFNVNGFMPNLNLQQERLKVIIEVLPADMNENTFKAIDINTTTDQDKIEYYNLYKGSIQYIESEELVFKNEAYVPDYGVIDLIKGLNIVVDEDGYNGVYRIYDSTGNIKAQSEADKRRVLTASYSSLITGTTELDKAEKITWIFPRNNTMIQAPEEGIEFAAGECDVNKYPDRYEISRLGSIRTTVPGNEEPDSTQQIFRIKKYYSQSATNNIIKCRMIRGNKCYESEVELIFGTHGTNGTDFTFELRFLHNEAAIPCAEGAYAFVKPIIYDACNNDITKTGIFKNIEYSWYSKYDDSSIILAENDTPEGWRQIQIKTSDISKCQYYILQATATGTIDYAQPGQSDTTSRSVKITAYLPIPVRANGQQYYTIDGANIIRYSSSGTTPSYYDGLYTLHNYNNRTGKHEDVNVTWESSFGKDCEEATKAGFSFYPHVTKDGKLSVPTLYLQGTGRQMAINAMQLNKQTGKTEIIWTQPIMVLLEAYGSPLINSWDGNLTLDEKNGTILTAMIGAGVKNLDNSFSGVLMGDISKTGEVLTGVNADYYNGLGLYGYDAGNRSFGLNVNGKAFFGKAGRGQILINGNEGIIRSALFDSEHNYTGLKIDLDEGIIEANSPMRESGQAKVLIDPTVQVGEEKPYFQVMGENHNNLIYFGPGSQYLRSYNYGFSNGGTYQGTIFDLTNGLLASYGSNGSYVKLTSGEKTNGKFFEIYDGAAHQTIFSANGGSTHEADAQGWKPHSESASDSVSTENAFITYVKNNIKNVNNISTIESVVEGYPKDEWKVVSRTIQKKMEDGKEVEYYRIIYHHNTTERKRYTGESKIHPNQKKNASKDSIGDVRNSSITITKAHTTTTVYTAVVPVTKLKTYMNRDNVKAADADVDSFLNDQLTLDKLNNECFIALITPSTIISQSEYTTADLPHDIIISSSVRYEEMNRLHGVVNGQFYLQSSNYDGHSHGTMLNLSEGYFTTFGSDGSYIKINGNGIPFFEIFDAKGCDVATGTSGTGKNLFYASNGRYYLQSSNFRTSSTNYGGMKLDISNGSLIMYNNNGKGGYVRMSGSGAPYFNVHYVDDSGTHGCDLIRIGGSDYYLQSKDYNTGHSGVRIDLVSSRIDAYKFTIMAYQNDTSTNCIRIDSSSATPLLIQGADGDGHHIFSVSYSGKVQADYLTATQGGQIGPFFMNNISLYTADSTFGGAGIYLGTEGLSVSNGTFKVNSAGSLTSTDGTIGAWKIGTDTLQSTNNKIILNAATGSITCYDINGAEVFKTSSSSSVQRIGPWRFSRNKFYGDDGDEGTCSEITPSGTFRFKTSAGAYVDFSGSGFTVRCDRNSETNGYMYLGTSRLTIHTGGYSLSMSNVSNGGGSPIGEGFTISSSGTASFTVGTGTILLVAGTGQMMSIGGSSSSSYDSYLTGSTGVSIGAIKRLIVNDSGCTYDGKQLATQKWVNDAIKKAIK